MFPFSRKRTPPLKRGQESDHNQTRGVTRMQHKSHRSHVMEPHQLNATWSRNLRRNKNKKIVPPRTRLKEKEENHGRAGVEHDNRTHTSLRMHQRSKELDTVARNPRRWMQILSILTIPIRAYSQDALSNDTAKSLGIVNNIESI